MLGVKGIEKSGMILPTSKDRIPVAENKINAMLMATTAARSSEPCKQEKSLGQQMPRNLLISAPESPLLY